LADSGKGNALFAADAPQVLIGQLDEDAGAIAQQWVVPGRSTVRQILEDFETLVDQRVGAFAFDVYDESDAASIVFVLGIVEPMLRRRFDGRWQRGGDIILCAVGAGKWVHA
jgi:hypothetical protein